MTEIGRELQPLILEQPDALAMRRVGERSRGSVSSHQQLTLSDIPVITAFYICGFRNAIRRGRRRGTHCPHDLFSAGARSQLLDRRK